MKEKLTISIEKAERKKNPPSTAFKPGNPHRFEAGGPSPNPGGRAGKKNRLLSRALKARLDGRAPASVTDALKLGRGSSWAQCLASALVVQAIRGDVQASRLIAEYVEPIPTRSLALGFDPDMGEDGDGALGPALVVNFVSAEGTSATEIAEGRVIDQKFLPPRDRDPAAVAARQEQERAAAARASVLPPPSPAEQPSPSSPQPSASPSPTASPQTSRTATPSAPTGPWLGPHWRGF